MSSSIGKPATFESIEGAIAAIGDKTPMGDAFEHAVLHYLEHDPVVGVKQAWLWDDWPERIDLGLDRDQGVDIVAIDGEGKRVAVQVKFHSDPAHNVTQREVATLFSFRSDLFERWWIVSNAVGRSANAEKATAYRGDVSWVHRDDLVASDIDWSAALEAVSGKAKPVVEPADPREPDQTAAIADTLEALKRHERAQLIMACGTGKTLVTRWITEARKDRLVLVLVPTLLLLKQFRTQWREHARHDFVDLGVCSDADTMGRDEWTVHPDELGVRVTTDPADIATFLRGTGRRVVFGTYASSTRIAEAQADPLVPAFDLVIADEAHRVAGIISRGNDQERGTRVVLDSDRIRARRRLFATATPRVYTKATRSRLEGHEDIEFASMDDPEHFGAEAHRLWFRRAVELGRLVDYRLSVVVVTDTEVARLVRDRAIVDVQGRTFDAETLAALIAVRRAVDQLRLKRVIAFHHTIKRARDFAVEIERLELDAPAVAAEHISGAMSMADRQRVLGRLREPERPTVVTNARCLTEGIDVPSLDAVAFMDPRSSPIDIVQAVGRVMRTARDKQLGHVIVPVFLRKQQLADPEAAIESSAFEPVLAVLRALRAHDPELVSDATRIATSLGRRDAVVSGYISEHIQLLGAEVDVNRVEQALQIHFVDVAMDLWEIGHRRLRAYVQRTGSIPLSSHKEADGYRLGAWVANRRAEHVRGRLAPHRVTTLETVPGWTWDPLDDKWRTFLAHLKLFSDEHGHARPPTTYRSPDGYRLGARVLKMRSRYHEEQSSAGGDGAAEPATQRSGSVGGARLTPERIAVLEASPGWSWGRRDDEWDRMFDRLRRFEARHDHTRVTSGYRDEDGKDLGGWVKGVRRRYTDAKLDASKAARLESLASWSWESYEAQRWCIAVQALKGFHDEHGHLRVPRGCRVQEINLESWLMSRRREYRDGMLSRVRREELETISGFSQAPYSDQWSSTFAELAVFVEGHGSSRVPRGHKTKDGVDLGAWVTAQRALRRRGELEPERARKLMGLSDWTWDTNEQLWLDGLARVRRCLAEHGTAWIRADYRDEDGFALGKWASKRRSEHRRGRLDPGRVAVLEGLAGWEWEQGKAHRRRRAQAR